MTIGTGERLWIRPAIRRLTATGLLACLLVALPSTACATPRAPADFFGIVPQTELTEQDIAYMRAGRISSVRVPVPWSSVQPTAAGGYNWSGLDHVVAVTARAGLRVLPFLYATPRWVARKPTTLPVNSAKALSAWRKFLRAAVKRYGPGGEFWTLHSQAVGGEPAIPRSLPIRMWQIWNEANFFYFALPVSPRLYAKLLTISSRTIKAADPGAKVILTGLFGKPSARGKRGMFAARFLDALYRVRGIKRRFDGVALHPYAINTKRLKEVVKEFHRTIIENHDHVPLYITEMGWGSQNDFHVDAFEHGLHGQARELRRAYSYLLANRRRLNLKQVYWFSWKDVHPTPCNFCDSAGLFHAGAGFKAKPAWRSFVAITHGRTHPRALLRFKSPVR